MSVFSNSVVKFSWFVRNVAINPVYLSALFLPIPIIGLVSEYFFDLAFARSGAVLVCVAIFCVYINHFLSVESENIKSVIQGVNKIGTTREEISRRLNPAIKGGSRDQAIDGTFDLLESAKMELPILIDAKDKLVRVEFLAGVFGTLIWGFGDILPY